MEPKLPLPNGIAPHDGDGRPPAPADSDRPAVTAEPDRATTNRANSQLSTGPRTEEG